ncbi:signal peptidase I [Planctomicrobium sp. SH527]|uniref:signal peptidase I n=1 Tax=Planctomicrobium sp. SH527 TaxID=3448123 RepID=UPI003F5AE9E5
MLDFHPTAPAQPATAGTFRHVAESFVLLAVAVILFRGFAAEGFMISTGSMAPTLLGYHRQVVCPECQFEFARGAAPSNEEGTQRFAQANYDIGLEIPTEIRCPNCSLTDIEFQTLPRTEGDQLLVHKHAYEFRDPRRWEVIVFRNPSDPRQAYVKRVAGLPGETIELRSGDVYADGKLCRKPLSVQRSMKVPIARYKNRTSGKDPDSWPGWTARDSDSAWKMEPSHLSINRLGDQFDIRADWIDYRHWIRAGGQHRSQAPLAKWPREIDLKDDRYSRLKYENGIVTCSGVMTDVERRGWLAKSDSAGFHEAINALYEQSHIAPIIDDSGYNAVTEGNENPVDEFFLTLTLKDVQGTGCFEMELLNSSNRFTVTLDFGQYECRLTRNDDAVPVRVGSLSTKAPHQEIHLEFSTFDSQVVVAINGKEALSPFAFETTSDTKSVKVPARFGVSKLACQVLDVELSRDVYYTPVQNEDSITTKLGEEEFYVLGDNSRVSVDSRVWPDPAVPKRALIGKPLFVHLPSSTTRIMWNGKSHDVRIPDFSRTRIIR